MSTTPTNPVPNPPTGLTVTAGNAQSTITWTVVTGATSYNLYWSTTSTVTTASSKIENIPSPFVHTGLTNGTTYYYILTALNATGESVPSAQMSATLAITFKVTFRTTNIYTGSGTISLANTDVICNNDSAKPAGKTFKSFLGVSGTRESTGTDWVFYANQEYRRTDGTIIGTTNANKVFTAMNSGLCTPTSTTGWNGISNGATWLVSLNNCVNWSSGIPSDFGQTGDMGAGLISSLLTPGSSGCNSSAPFCCIEQ